MSVGDWLNSTELGDDSSVSSWVRSGIDLVVDRVGVRSILRSNSRSPN